MKEKYAGNDKEPKHNLNEKRMESTGTVTGASIGTASGTRKENESFIEIIEKPLMAILKSEEKESEKKSKANEETAGAITENALNSTSSTQHSLNSSFDAGFLRKFITQICQDLLAETQLILRNDIQNVHLEIIKQFHNQKIKNEFYF
jgi:hypothetical protein